MSTDNAVIARLVGARALNTFGRQVMSATVLWELYARTGDAGVIGFVGLAQVIPVVLLFVPAGTLVDGSDRRRLATIAAVATGGVGLGLALSSAFALPVIAFLALLAIQGALNAIHAPSASSLIPLIIDREDLPRVNRISASVQELASITGPAVAGLLLAVADAHWVYAIIAATGITAGVLYRSLPEPRAMPSDPAALAARRDWRAGLRFIWRSPLLLPALTLDMFAVLFAGVPALLPVIAKDLLHVGPLGYGVLRSAQAVGAVGMSILGGRIAPWKRPGLVLLVVVALFSLATVAFGFVLWFPVSVALLVLCGALDNVSVVIRLTLEQMVVPDSIRGRVSAVHYVFIGMSNELGASESGFAAHTFGTVPAIIGGGAVAFVVVAIVAAKWRALANMRPLAELQPDESSRE